MDVTVGTCDGTVDKFDAADEPGDDRRTRGLAVDDRDLQDVPVRSRPRVAVFDLDGRLESLRNEASVPDADDPDSRVCTTCGNAEVVRCQSGLPSDRTSEVARIGRGRLSAELSFVDDHSAARDYVGDGKTS